MGQQTGAVFHGLATCQFRRGWPDVALATIRDGLRNRPPSKFLLDLGVQVAVAMELYDEAAKFLDDLRRLDASATFHHRAATLLSAQGAFEEALVHAEQALEGTRTRFEALANRVDILIELGEFDRAATELGLLDARFRLANPTDVRHGLRCKLLLREHKWRLAEQVLEQVSKKTSPHYIGQRIDILEQKAKDPSVSPGQRESALTEKARLERLRAQKRSVFEEEVEEAVDDPHD